MAADPLRGATLKYQWATKHVHEVGRLAFFFVQDRGNYSVIAEPNPASPDELLVKIKMNAVPDDLYLTMGDALYNLRSALDLLACGLPRLKGKSNNGIYFPICDSKTEFEKPEAQRKIRKLTPDARKFIERCQPYKGGDDDLYFLHRLNIRDKHKSLVPSRPHIGIPGPIKHEGLNPAKIFTPSLWNAADQTITVASVGPSVDTEVKMPLVITFDEPGVFEGEPIYLVLLKFLKTVTRIVESARQEFYP